MPYFNHIPHEDFIYKIYIIYLEKSTWYADDFLCLDSQKNYIF